MIVLIRGYLYPILMLFSVDMESTPPTTASSTASDIRPIMPQNNRYENTSNSTVPMPTLYNGSNDGHQAGDPNRSGAKPRMGTIEVLLYNMASMLAGVAVGYDVRLSNVSPIHPKLYPKSDEDDPEGRRFYEGQQRVSGPALYPHNTYHGPGLGYNQHQRTPLAQANFRPLKFTDTPVHYPIEDPQGSLQDDEVIF